ncbi:MAG TPA: hypothetical protein DEF77_00555 [Gammaproteobacteria bacterium]|nr:hypothetical protein [Gammaproteobacteria bacterium]
MTSAVSYIPDQYAATSGRTSRASQLAVELATEKKRLIDELRELQAENDDLKSTTPVGTTDWYVKWVATFLSVSGIFLMSAGLEMQGQVAYVISAVGWIFVGVQWSDRAIMIGSSISATAVAMDLFRALTN